MQEIIEQIAKLNNMAETYKKNRNELQKTEQEFLKKLIKFMAPIWQLPDEILTKKNDFGQKRQISPGILVFTENYPPTDVDTETSQITINKTIIKDWGHIEPCGEWSYDYTHLSTSELLEIFSLEEIIEKIKYWLIQLEEKILEEQNKKLKDKKLQDKIAKIAKIKAIEF
jgi:hypothetical protein